MLHNRVSCCSEAFISVLCSVELLNFLLKKIFFCFIKNAALPFFIVEEL